MLLTSCKCTVLAAEATFHEILIVLELPLASYTLQHFSPEVYLVHEAKFC